MLPYFGYAGRTGSRDRARFRPSSWRICPVGGPIVLSVDLHAGRSRAFFESDRQSLRRPGMSADIQARFAAKPSPSSPRSAASSVPARSQVLANAARIVARAAIAPGIGGDEHIGDVRALLI